MKLVLRVFAAIHAVMATLFAITALLLIAMATHKGWIAVSKGLTEEAAQQIIEAIGYLAAAVVALQISQTIAEEEVIREAHVSAPTRVRRFLSRFLIVLVVALAIEGLVSTFKGVHSDSSALPGAAGILIGTAALLVAWGAFIRLNRSAEELEPEAMEEAKREDQKLSR
jgi:hypothetical protein